MRRSTGNETARQCLACARPTTEPRKGLCFACYQRQGRGHETALECACCGVKDRRVLRRHRLGEDWSTLCANCSAIAGKRPLTLEVLKAEVFPVGDRRSAGRRICDRRVPAERRHRVEIAGLLNDLRNHDRRNHHASSVDPRHGSRDR